MLILSFIDQIRSFTFSTALFIVYFYRSAIRIKRVVEKLDNKCFGRYKVGLSFWNIS